MRYIPRTPRGFVRLRGVNTSGNLGFTLPMAISRRMEAAGQYAGDMYRPVLLPDGVAFIKVEPKDRPARTKRRRDASRKGGSE